MMRQRWTALAFMAGLACAASGPVLAGNAEDDTIRARLVETGNGIRVVFKFTELTKNDTKKPFVNPILKRQLLKTKGSAGIDALYFRGGGKKGPLKVVVKFTKSFLNKVYADGREFTEFEYRVRDLCKKDKCGGPLGWAIVDLRVRGEREASPD